MPHFTGGKGLPIVQLPAKDNGSADAGAIGQAEEVGAAGGSAQAAFSHSGAVDIVVNAHRDA